MAPCFMLSLFIMPVFHNGSNIVSCDHSVLITVSSVSLFRFFLSHEKLLLEIYDSFGSQLKILPCDQDFFFLFH